MNTATKLEQAINTINYDEKGTVGGEYGLHDGFFNILVVVDGVNYHAQGCADNDVFDANDCGHDWGICGDVNAALARKLAEDFDGELSEGYAAVEKVLSAAYNLFICHS